VRCIVYTSDMQTPLNDFQTDRTHLCSEFIPRLLRRKLLYFSLLRLFPAPLRVKHCTHGCFVRKRVRRDARVSECASCSLRSAGALDLQCQYKSWQPHAYQCEVLVAKGDENTCIDTYATAAKHKFVGASEKSI
jgi:hypothetical protein